MIICPHNVAEPHRCGLCDDEFQEWWRKVSNKAISPKRAAESAWYAARDRTVDEPKGES